MSFINLWGSICSITGFGVEQCRKPSIPRMLIVFGVMLVAITVYVFLPGRTAPQAPVDPPKLRVKSEVLSHTVSGEDRKDRSRFRLTIQNVSSEPMTIVGIGMTMSDDTFHDCKRRVFFVQKASSTDEWKRVSNPDGSYYDPVNVLLKPGKRTTITNSVSIQSKRPGFHGTTLRCVIHALDGYSISVTPVSLEIYCGTALSNGRYVSRRD
jgi:hypothetical protein